MTRVILSRKSPRNQLFFDELSSTVEVLELDLVKYRLFSGARFQGSFPPRAVIASSRAVEAMELSHQWEELKLLKYICVGANTAQKAQDKGLKVLTIVSRMRELTSVDQRDLELLYPCSSCYHRQELEELQQAGVSCIPWVVYEVEMNPVAEENELGSEDLIVIFSGSQASSMVASFPASRYHKVFVMGPRTAGDCKALGFTQVYTSKFSNLNSLIDGLKSQIEGNQ